MWPPIGFEIKNLFKEEIKEILACHPKIMDLMEDLKFTREYVSETPKGSIELALFLFKWQTTQSSAMVKIEETEARL